MLERFQQKLTKIYKKRQSVKYTVFSFVCRYQTFNSLGRARAVHQQLTYSYLFWDMHIQNMALYGKREKPQITVSIHLAFYTGMFIESAEFGCNWVQARALPYLIHLTLKSVL